MDFSIYEQDIFVLNEIYDNTYRSILYESMGKGEQFLYKQIDSMIQKMADVLRKYVDIDLLKTKYYDGNKVAQACLLFLVLVISSMMTDVMISFIFKAFPKLAEILGATILAPIIEELGKAIAISGKFVLEFFIVFNALEILGYIIEGKSYYEIKDILKARFVPLIMHTATTLIEFASKSKKILRKLHIPSSQFKLCSTIGYILGVIIHSYYNFSMLNPDSKLGQFLEDLLHGKEGGLTNGEVIVQN